MKWTTVAFPLHFWKHFDNKCYPPQATASAANVWENPFRKWQTIPAFTDSEIFYPFTCFQTICAGPCCASVSNGRKYNNVPSWSVVLVSNRGEFRGVHFLHKHCCGRSLLPTVRCNKGLYTVLWGKSGHFKNVYLKKSVCCKLNRRMENELRESRTLKCEC